MNVSLDESLRKLRTHYVDIFYVHWWDHTASVEEVMNGLHTLILSRKVLYLVRVRLGGNGGEFQGLTSHRALGNIRCAGVGRCARKSVCKGSWQDTIRCLSRGVECDVALI